MIYIGKKWDLLNAKRNYETRISNAKCALFFYKQTQNSKFLTEAINDTCQAIQYKKLMIQLEKE